MIICYAYDKSESFLSKVAFDKLRKFLLSSRLSQMERVLFLKVLHTVIGQSQTCDISDWSVMVAILCVMTESAIIVVKLTLFYNAVAPVKNLAYLH